MLYKELPAEGGTRNQNHGQFKIIQLSGSHPINKNIEMSNGIPEPWLIECFHIKINPVFTICMIIVWACPWLARFIFTLQTHIKQVFHYAKFYTCAPSLQWYNLFRGNHKKKKKMPSVFPADLKNTLSPIFTLNMFIYWDINIVCCYGFHWP